MSAANSVLAPRLGDRSLWSRLEARAYLNHAGISPWSEPVCAAVERVSNATAARGSLALSERLAEQDAARDKLATLLSATTREIALVPNTMYGLASIALSIPWRAGDRIVAFAGEYPTNVMPFARAAELFGLTLVLLPAADLALPGGPDLSRLQHELARGVRLCALSAVQFQTGMLAPLAQVAELCHAHGAELVVDAVQAAGAVPLDVHALGIDYLAAGAHKWLLGSTGAGVLYVREPCLPKLRPAITGNMSYDGALDMLLSGPGHLRYDRKLREDAQVFEGGMLSSPSVAALDASLGLLLQLGVPHIHRHVNAYLDALEPLLVARGFVSLRAGDAARRSCTLALQPPSPWTAPELSAALCAQGIVCSCPDGLLRFTPHWPNGVHEVPLIVAALDALLARAH